MNNSRYSISEFASNVYALVLTKLFYRGARLVRRPTYIRGKECLNFEPGLTLGHSCRFDLPGGAKTLFIGRNCEFGDNTHIVAYKKVEIGHDVLLASKVFISDTNHGSYKGEKHSSPDVPPNIRELVYASVKIGNNVWIGENAVILAGSVIGNGCIIGANSVVSGVVEDNTMIAGAPAKAIKKFSYEKGIWERC